MYIDFSKQSRAIRFFWNQLVYMCLLVIASIRVYLGGRPPSPVRPGNTEEVPFPSIALAGSLLPGEETDGREILRAIEKETQSSCILAYWPQEPQDERAEDAVTGVRFFNLWKCNDVILDLGGLRIGVSVFSAESGRRSLYRLLKRRRLLQKGGAQMTVAYVRRGEVTYGQFKKDLKRIARSGYDAAAGESASVRARRNMRTLSFSATSIFYGLGEISPRGCRKNGLNPSVVIKLAFDPQHRRIAQQGYFPAFMRREGDCTYTFGIGRAAERLATSERQMLYRFLQKRMKGLRRWSELLYLRDVFAALGEKLPEKYAFLADYTVNYLCSRTVELAPGNVFFFRQQFRDRNDEKPESEIRRLKLAFRAAMRQPLFIFSYRRLWPGLPHIVVADGIEAHIAAAAQYRERLQTVFVGITGSVGKTSTKDMLHGVLAENFRTEKSSKNANVQIRIGANLQKVSDGTEIFIQEIGGGRPGGASRHSRMIAPDAAVITNIGTAHLGNFGSQEELAENKLQITEGLRKGGTLFLNGDDPLLRRARPDCRVCYYAVYDRSADYYAENIRESGTTTSFDIVWRDGRFPVTLQVPGIYNVLNAVCCFAIGRFFGMRDQDIATGLAKFKTSGTRQNLVNVGGYRLFVDCFNASLDSVESSLSVLKKLEIEPGKRKNAVIGDITGMGEMSAEINRKIAAIVDRYAEYLDQLVLYGKNAEEVASAMKHFPARFQIVRDPAQLNRWIKSEIRSGDVTLFKGGSKSKLDERIDDVFGTNFADGKYVEESRYRSLQRRNVNYRIFTGHATLLRGGEETTSARIRGRIAGKKIQKIGMESFLNHPSLETVSAGRHVLHIGSKSFFSCSRLKKVEHQNSILFIGKSAFANCTNLIELQIPQKLRFMGAGAFKNCSALEQVRIPAGCADIPPQAFAGCRNLRKVVVEPGVRQLWKQSFADCRGLEEIRLPGSVTRVGDLAFQNCINLKRVYAAADAHFSRNAFAGCGKVEIIRENPADPVPAFSL